MYRMIGLLGVAAALSACGDGRGSQYSSERARISAVTYAPVTQGAGPVTLQGQQTLAGPIAVTPGSTPIQAGGGQARVVTTAALPSASPSVVKFATGPIYSACLGAGRQGATQTRCGCVQWVADRQLTEAQQKRGARYFEQNHDLQEVRQSDGRSDEDFWQAWQSFGATAGTTCSAS